MRRVEFHRRAVKALRRIPQNRARRILDAIGELAVLPNPANHPNARPMQGEWQGAWRMRIGEYRVIFRIYDDGGGEEAGLIAITHIGSRGGIYG